MKFKSNLLIILSVFISLSNPHASTMGSGEIYITSTAMRNICVSHFPSHENEIRNQYNNWANENKKEMDKMKSIQNYPRFLQIAEALVNDAVNKKAISSKEFKYKCFNMYKSLKSETSNK